MFTPTSILTGGTYFPYSTDGLVALYNTNASGAFAGDTIYDLSGNGNDLKMTGSYFEGTGSDAGSIFFASGSTARTAGNLSTSLHGTGSEMTIIYYAKWDRMPLNYPDPSWFIGGATLSSDQRQIYERGGNISTTIGFGVSSAGAIDSSEAGRVSLFEMTGSILATSPSYLWKPIQQFGYSVGENFWSVLGVTKANQTLTYTIPDSNVNLLALNYEVSNLTGPGSGGFISGSLLSNTKGFMFPSGYEEVGGFIYAPSSYNVLSTALDSSILQINPSGYAFTLDYGGGFYGYRQQWFGGMAIYDRVLSSREILNITTYFNQTRLTV